MPIVPINYLAVLSAALLSMVVGFLWYGPLFGKQWMLLAGMTKEKIDEMKKKGMTNAYCLMFVGSLIMAYVLSHAIIFATFYLKTSGISVGLMVGFWNWLGFIAPVTLASVLWDGKPWKLWILNNAYHVVTLMLMGMVLTLWM